MENRLQIILQKKRKWILLLLIGVLLLVIAMPTTSSTNSEEKYALDEEMRLKHILEQMENVGEVRVMITHQDSKTVEGVVVIADGAENVLIVKNITDVVQALFDVDSHKIKVMKGNHIN